MKFLIQQSALALWFYISMAVGQAYAGCSSELAESNALQTRLDQIQALLSNKDPKTQKPFAQTKAGKFTHITPVYDAQMDTLRYELTAGRLPSSAEVFVPLFHGGGTTQSHSHAMIQILHIVTAQTGTSSQIIRSLIESPKRVVMAAEAVDQPGHGFGPSPDRFPTLDSFMLWLRDYFDGLKKQGVKIIPITRSASTGYLLEFNRRFPGRLDGLVMMSPVHPVAGFEEGVHALLEQAEQGRLVLNRPGLDFVTSMYRSMDWKDLKSSADRLSILILAGGLDREVPAVAREAFRALIENGHPLSRFHFEENSGHEVLGVRDKEIAVRAFGAVQDFIYSVLRSPR